jgi:hypothetical protein
MEELLVLVILGLVIGLCAVAVLAAWLYMTAKNDE